MTAAVILIAIIIVAAIGAYGLSLMGAATTVTKTSTSTVTTTVSGQPGVTVTTTKTVTSTVTTSGTATGVVSILVTDPPQVPNGVTSVHISYANMYLHIAGLPDGEGWISVSSSGSIELLGAVDVGQTVASTNIPAETYNQIRFNVTSAQVTFNGQNYSAIVQNGNLTIHLIGSLTIDPSQPSALIVDVQPFVFNFGSTNDPQFILKPSAFSFLVPPTSVTPQMQQLGYRYQIQSSYTWFWQNRQGYLPALNFTSASLSNVSLSAVVKNISNQTVMLRAIIVTPIQNTSHGQPSPVNSTTGPSGYSGSAVFLVLQNGTLRQLTQQEYGTGPLNLATAIWGGVGYNLSASLSASLSYGGLIQLGLRLPPGTQVGVVTTGQQYVMTVVGDGATASVVVTAS